jgi:hypothetical protein
MTSNGNHLVSRFIRQGDARSDYEACILTASKGLRVAMQANDRAGSLFGIEDIGLFK